MKGSGLSLALLLGCSCGASSPSTAVAPLSIVSPAIDYEVHEWGLVRAEAGDVLRAGAVAPPVAVTPLVVFKPVLYFHTAAPLTLASVEVRASTGGSLTEVWPLTAFDTTARWEDVALDPTGACEVSALPAAADPPCSTLAAGDLCEAAGLAVARTTDGACVTVGTAVERFLFYRARVTQFTPPLAFERTATPHEVRVTNEGTLAIPGRLVRIRSSMGVVQAFAVDPPAPGSSLTVGATFEDAAPAATLPPAYWSGPSSAASGRAALRSSMLEIGLTEPEADSFLAAWDDALFGVPAALDLSAQPPVESFVYFLPEPSTDGIAVLELDPAPRAVHRAIAVWSVVRAQGSSH